MSLFAAVDDDDDPQRVVAYLDGIARSATGMKHYAAAAHARGRPTGWCSTWVAGRATIWCSSPTRALHLSASTRAQCSRRGPRTFGTAPLIRATGESLPFGDASLAGCRIERADPRPRSRCGVVGGRPLPQIRCAPHGV